MPQNVQCPQCKSAVTIRDQAAGQRVKCPKCEKVFLAPGFAPRSKDDDDWLLLDHETPAIPAAPPAAAGSSPPAKSSPAKSSPAKSPPAKTSSDKRRPDKSSPGETPPPLSRDDEAVLGQYDFGLDDFTSGVEPLPSATGGETPSGGDNIFDDLPPADSAAPAPKQAEEIEFESEYRVKCNICGSIMYAKAEQQGKQVTCSDCHTLLTIPAPPRKKKKANLSVDNAQTFGFEATKTKERIDPYRKSAAELLEAAEQDDEEEEKPNYDTPDVKEWLMNVFGIFIDPGVLAHWLGLSFIATVPALIAFSFESQILVLALFPGAILLVTLVVACGFAILQSVANQEKSVSEWPTMDPVGWFEQLLVAFAAAGLAGIPAWTVGQIFFEPGLLAIALTMFSVYSLFPIFILSMLDMQSVMIPISPEVARSASRCQEAWGGFYFSSGLLFAGLFLFFVSLSSASPSAMAALGIIATIGVAFAYFAMIGRLAYSIGQVVNDPPKKSELDRSNPTAT